jgi:hypothetical protein
MNEPGRIKLCWNCQQATKICAMEDVIAALEALEIATCADEGDAPSYALVPLNEMGWLWEAYDRYKGVA